MKHHSELREFSCGSRCVGQKGPRAPTREGYNFQTKEPGRKRTEEPKHLPRARRLRRVVRIGPGIRQIWSMLERGNQATKTFQPLAAVFDEENVKSFNSVLGGYDRPG